MMIMEQCIVYEAIAIRLPPSLSLSALLLTGLAAFKGGLRTARHNRKRKNKQDTSNKNPNLTNLFPLWLAISRPVHLPLAALACFCVGSNHQPTGCSAPAPHVKLGARMSGFSTDEVLIMCSSLIRCYFQGHTSKGPLRRVMTKS